MSDVTPLLMVDDDEVFAATVTKRMSYLAVDLSGRVTQPQLAGRVEQPSLAGTAAKTKDLTGSWES